MHLVGKRFLKRDYACSFNGSRSVCERSCLFFIINLYFYDKLMLDDIHG